MDHAEKRDGYGLSPRSENSHLPERVVTGLSRATGGGLSAKALATKGSELTSTKKLNLPRYFAAGGRGVNHIINFFLARRRGSACDETLFHVLAERERMFYFRKLVENQKHLEDKGSAEQSHQSRSPKQPPSLVFRPEIEGKKAEQHEDVVSGRVPASGSPAGPPI